MLRFLDIARNTRAAIYSIIVTPIVVHGRGRKRDGDITLRPRKLLCFLRAEPPYSSPMHHGLIAVEQPRFHPVTFAGGMYACARVYARDNALPVTTTPLPSNYRPISPKKLKKKLGRAICVYRMYVMATNHV